MFQPYAVPRARIHVDRLTGTTNCQGVTLDPDLAWDSFGELAAEYVVKNVNVNVLGNPYKGTENRYAWWLTGGTSGEDGCLSGPIVLRNVYADQPDGTLRMNSVWPDTDRPDACRSVWEAPTLLFPRSPQITGVVTAGMPPGGDYVPEGVAGIAYVSPGYLGSPSTPAPHTVGGTVPATLALTLGAPASFGTFVPGVDATYTASTTASVVSTAGDAALSVSDPGHLANGAFALVDPLQVLSRRPRWAAPVSHDPVTISFTQHIVCERALTDRHLQSLADVHAVHDDTLSRHATRHGYVLRLSTSAGG